MAVLIKREIEQSEFNPLDEEDRDVLPPVWSGGHVSLRLVEALQTLRLLPSGGGDGGASSAWPNYRYEWEDLVAQNEQGELERTQKIQNRTRVSPSLNDISRMEVVIQWPMQYLLFGAPHLVDAVMWLAHAYSMERDAAWLVRKRGGFTETWMARHGSGCSIIANGLLKDRVPVF